MITVQRPPLIKNLSKNINITGEDTQLDIQGAYYNFSGVSFIKSPDVRSSSGELNHRAELWRGELCRQISCTLMQRQISDAEALQFMMTLDPHSGPHSGPQTSLKGFLLPSSVCERFTRNSCISSLSISSIISSSLQFQSHTWLWESSSPLCLRLWLMYLLIASCSPGNSDFCCIYVSAPRQTVVQHSQGKGLTFDEALETAVGQRRKPQPREQLIIVLRTPRLGSILFFCVKYYQCLSYFVLSIGATRMNFQPPGSWVRPQG